MSNIVNVTCAIILIENKILVAQRSDKMKLPLKWEFPGGKLEENESEIDCIKREIKEEINIEIEVLRKLSNSIYDYGNFKINLIPFIAKHILGEIILAEHKDYKLLEKVELLNLDWAEADLPIVEEFLKLEL
ncbi:MULTISPECIES: (deoxy)nucleoside triphosphate pyrophosphohydrolase [unclassified Flavobacterium]|jgi:8-oxo-dGTP diphosphatase|uniref:(deoxy)nucleoside triphosphate pyrophosphohydrolase n=1 Tax=unclassified Flavobacterium TaxID=196869 RepID=UPI000F100EDD|nr:NUDIX domain-containing protein [Flavobacterium sp. 120]RKS12947.1 8-oxo-dGTP diphosphatase [Flavobacterium sp. 120]